MTQTNVIKVKFLRGGAPHGQAYSYYASEVVVVGDIVDLDSSRGTAQGVVVETNVPLGEITKFGDRAKHIIGKHLENMELSQGRMDDDLPF